MSKEETDVKFKKYASRSTEDPQREICYCGHDSIYHNNFLENSNRDWTHYNKTIRLIGSSGKIFNEERPTIITKCEKCMCPEFKKVCTMTEFEYLKIHGEMNK